MGKTPTHPHAEYPLDSSSRTLHCSLPRHHPTFLTILMLENSLRLCAPFVKGSLLDVGCGMRPYEKTFFAGAEKYLGTDYLSDRSRPDVVASALSLPFADASFDTVTSTEVLEHVPDPLRALKEMRRIVKSNGFLILSTPMYWPRHEMPYDYFRYPYDGMLHLLKESGWELVKIYNRGKSYAFLGQVIMHVSPKILHWKPLTWILNSFFLWCDMHRDNDTLTMGWTVLAKPAISSLIAESPEPAENNKKAEAH
jgi:SAM-dependent methyltransferase